MDRRRAFVLIVTIGSVVVAMLLIGAAFGGSLTPCPIPAVLQRAGEEFVVAFARPLIDSSSSASAHSSATAVQSASPGTRDLPSPPVMDGNTRTSWTTSETWSTTSSA